MGKNASHKSVKAKNAVSGGVSGTVKQLTVLREDVASEPAVASKVRDRVKKKDNGGICRHFLTKTKKVTAENGRTFKRTECVNCGEAWQARADVGQRGLEDFG